MIPVENHDGTSTYMMVSLDKNSKLKISAAEGNKINVIFLLLKGLLLFI